MTLTWAQAVIEALAWTLLHFLWQGSLLGLTHWLALRNLRSATARYVVSLIALGCVLLTPVATFLHLHESPAAPVVASGVAPVMPEALPVTGNPPVSVAPGDHLELLPPLVVGIWLIGVLLLALRFMGGLLHVRRLTRGARFDLVPSTCSANWKACANASACACPCGLPSPPCRSAPWCWAGGARSCCCR